MTLLRFINDARKKEIFNQTFDITNPAHWDFIETLAQQIYKNANNANDIVSLEEVVTSEKEKFPMTVQIAVKVALSKKMLSGINKKVHISILFAVYKENHRIVTKAEDELGEDFLIRKIKQMEFLTGEFNNISWDMIVVDDGCPEKSGIAAQQILKTGKEAETSRVKVLFLKDAIEQNLDVIKPLKSTDESRKGGSIEYGMYVAAQQQKSNHVIIFTDADLSTHLGQSGLLVNEIINHNKKAAIGSRRETKSVVVKKGTRNTRGKLFIYLWKRLISPLNYITDTQCGFKAFDAEIVNNLINNTLEKKFAFDIELLLKTELLRHHSIAKVAIAWYDSEAASTTTDLQPYLSMLQATAAMYRKYLPANPVSDEFADFIENMNETQWQKLVQKVPKKIAEGDPSDFHKFDEVKVHQLKKIIADS